MVNCPVPASTEKNGKKKSNQEKKKINRTPLKMYPTNRKRSVRYESLRVTLHQVELLLSTFNPFALCPCDVQAILTPPLP